jgi:RNA polymerase-binding transcription factor
VLNEGETQEVMRTNTVDGVRIQKLRQIINHERTLALTRVREIRQEQEGDVSPPPSDELDVARSLADVETHASLIERAEFRLKAIDQALSRLERSSYGICEDCGEEIPLERLKVLPFAACCVSCQEARNRGARPGEGALEGPSRRRWKLPEEMDESLEKQDSLTEPEEALSVRDRDPFGPEVGEFEQLPSAPNARRRGRPRKKEPSED